MPLGNGNASPVAPIQIKFVLHTLILSTGFACLPRTRMTIEKVFDELCRGLGILDLLGDELS